MDEMVKELHGELEKVIASLEGNFAKLRSGRANPAMLNGIKCDYYGEKMDITSLSSISSPEPRQLVVKPYSREDLKTIASAIASANLGVNPQVEADVIRIIVPPLTEDTRKDISKQAKALAEDAKVAIRNHRRDYMEMVKSDDGLSDDYKERVEDDIQKEVDEFNKKVDALSADKQKQIMTI